MGAALLLLLPPGLSPLTEIAPCSRVTFSQNTQRNNLIGLYHYYQWVIDVQEDSYILVSGIMRR